MLRIKLCFFLRSKVLEFVDVDYESILFVYKILKLMKEFRDRLKEDNSVYKVYFVVEVVRNWYWWVNFFEEKIKIKEKK